MVQIDAPVEAFVETAVESEHSGWDAPARNQHQQQQLEVVIEQSPIQAPDQNPPPRIITGPAGPAGPVGPMGPPGPPGDGLTQEQIQNMVVSISNTLRNDPAMKGQDGQPGKDATITIGTVTTGQVASVTNRGTPTDAIWDIVLPMAPAPTIPPPLAPDTDTSKASGILYFTVKGANNTWKQLDSQVNTLRQQGQPYVMIWLDPSEAVSVRDVPRIYNIDTKQSFTGLQAVTEYLGSSLRRDRNG